MADPDFQLTTPTLGSGLYQRKPLRLLDDDLKLDPTLVTWPGPFLGIEQTHPDLVPFLRLEPIFDAYRNTPPALRFPSMPEASPAPSGKGPNPEARPATFADLVDAVMLVPEVQRARDQLESIGQAQLHRAWADMKANPASFAVAVPLVVGVGFTG